MLSPNVRRVLFDVLLVGLSVALAVYLLRTDLVMHVLERSRGFEMLGSLVAGVFFTSVFTAAPAAATLAELTQVNGIFWTALLGGIGAVLGDLVIFRLVERRVAPEIGSFVAHSAVATRSLTFLARPYMRWVAWVLGVIVIASPFPDELGVALLGASQLGTARFMLIAFLGNAAGIVMIGLATRAL